MHCGTKSFANGVYLSANANRIHHKQATWCRSLVSRLDETSKCILNPRTAILSVKPLASALESAPLISHVWKLMLDQIARLYYACPITISEVFNYSRFSGTDWAR